MYILYILEIFLFIQIFMYVMILSTADIIVIIIFWIFLLVFPHFIY